MTRSTGGPAGTVLLAGSVVAVGADIDAETARVFVLAGRAEVVEGSKPEDGIVAAPAVQETRKRTR